MERKQLSLVALVAVMMLSAGCMGLFGGNDSPTPGTNTTDTPSNNGTDTPSNNGTDTPSNNGTDTPSDGNKTQPGGGVNGTVTMELPPGVTTDGSVNASTLIAAHRSEMNVQSFTTIHDVEFVADGLNFSYETTLKYTESATSIVFESGNQRTESWYGDGEGYRRIVSNDSTQYVRITEQSPKVRFTLVELISSHLTGGEFTLAGQTMYNGQTVAVLESSGVSDSASISQYHGVGQIESYNATMYVTSSGRVVWFDYALTASDSQTNQPTSYDGTYILRNVGSTTIQKPDWVSTARASAVQLEVTTNSSDLIAVKMTQGDTIPTGSRVDIGVSGQIASAKLGKDVSKGDTIYITGDGSGGVTVTVNEKPQNTASVPATFIFIVDKSGTPVTILRFENTNSRR